MIIGLRGPVAVYWLDAIVQFFGALIALFVSISSYKTYKVTSNKKFLYFCLAFLFLTIDMLIYAVLIPALSIYGNVIGDVYAGNLLYISRALNFVYIIFTLMAYLMFIFVYSKLEKKTIMGLLILLVSALAINSFILALILHPFTQNLSVISFNLSAALLLLFSVFYTGRNYSRKKELNSLLVFLTFVLITIAHLVFAIPLCSNLWNFCNFLKPSVDNFYLVGHVAQLIGYLSLVILYLRVYYGRKKK